MAEITITFCVPCRYQFKALEDADAILSEFAPRLEAVRLVPGERGVYDVAIDGEKVFSMDEALRFPEREELLEKIRGRLGEAR